MSKNLRRFLIVVLTVVLMLAIIAPFVSAGVTSVITTVSKKTSEALGNSGVSGITNIGGLITGVLQVLGIIIAIVVLLVLGIKYMTGSAEEKAEYKKTMIPYAVGAVLIFIASTVVNVLYQAATTINSAVS